ncbi:hypothetical protein KZJ38_06765 [Paraburkholderia edwinii]|uniref:Uncharacterized protein n=1 Tax=Paraburkholderia edwinii TaxID=2861782 RepID=A0ABX8ULX5_9BURK|nr:hypothetical protein [Paraburkholderia edwinii]QYD70018.1 hypothetical protein KZJ38_06765 [Paraburkholderia edwinii]
MDPLPLSRLYAAVARLIESGRYQHASEDLLHSAGIEKAETKSRISAPRDAARIGLSDVKAGQVRTFDTAQDLGHYLVDLAESALRPIT